VSHRPRVHNGVQHRRGCCCPICDPEGTVAANLRRLAREARTAPVAAPIAAARWFRRQIAPPPPTDADRRFKELLRSGLSAAQAIAQLEKELRQ
jgi:hypothetical protein